MLEADWRMPAYRGRPSILRPGFQAMDRTAGRFAQFGSCFPDRSGTRFHRNGFDWDIRGTLFEPAGGREAKTGFVLLHGGAGSEMELVETPDGRPGLAPLLADEGFTRRSPSPSRPPAARRDLAGSGQRRRDPSLSARPVACKGEAGASAQSRLHLQHDRSRRGAVGQGALARP